MKRRLRLAGWLVILVIGAFIARTMLVQWDQVRNYPWHFDLPLLLASFGVQFVQFLLIFALWLMLLGILGARRCLLGSGKVYFYSSLARYLPGNLWQVAGAAALGRCYGYSALQYGVASLYLPLLMIVSGLFLAMGGLPILDLENVVGPGAVALSVAGGLGIICFFLPPVHGRLWALVNRIFRTDLPTPRLGLREVARVFPVLLANWVLQAWAFFLFIQSFHPLPASAFPAMVVFVAASTTAGQLVFFVPAGIGVREGFFLLLFPQLMPPEVALAASVGSRVWYTVADVASVALVSAAIALRERLAPDAPACPGPEAPGEEKG